MKNKSLKIIISVIILLAIAGVFIYKQDSKIFLPENIFDATGKVPNTDIIFKYPSKGFYNLGIKITNKIPDENLIAGVHIEPTLEFDRNAQSAYVITEIKLLKNKENFKNIEEFASFFKTNSTATSFEKEYAKENGHFFTFDNRKYFIFKMTEDATIWTAFSIWENGTLFISLGYTNSFTPYSEAIYKNNDKLFLEILNNISFK